MARKHFIDYDESETFGRDRKRDRNGVKEQRRNERKQKLTSREEHMFQKDDE